MIRAYRARRRTFLLLSGSGVVAFLLTTGVMQAPRMGPLSLEPAESLLTEEAVLRHRIEAARAGRSLVVLDPRDSTLTLFLEGALVRRWRVSAMEAGRGARTLPGARGAVDRDGEPEAGGPAVVSHLAVPLWMNPALVPRRHVERRVIVSDAVEAPDPSGTDEFIPLPPDELLPTPARFSVGFDGGMTLEVVALGSDARPMKTGWSRRATAAVRAIVPPLRDRYRLRIEMDSVDAGALYRSFPASVSFVAMIPGQPAPGGA